MSVWFQPSYHFSISTLQLAHHFLVEYSHLAAICFELLKICGSNSMHCHMLTAGGSRRGLCLRERRVRGSFWLMRFGLAGIWQLCCRGYRKQLACAAQPGCGRLVGVTRVRRGADSTFVKLKVLSAFGLALVLLSRSFLQVNKTLQKSCKHVVNEIYHLIFCFTRGYVRRQKAQASAKIIIQWNYFELVFVQ